MKIIGEVKKSYKPKRIIIYKTIYRVLIKIPILINYNYTKKIIELKSIINNGK